MPGIVMDEVNGKKVENGSDSTAPVIKSPRSHSSPKRPQSEACQPPADGSVDTSIELLCGNVCEMRSLGDRSSSRLSSRSDAEESRLDSELHNLLTGEMRAVEIMEEEVDEEKSKEDIGKAMLPKMENGSASGNSKTEKSQSLSTRASSAVHSRRASRSQLDSEASDKSSPKGKISPAKPSMEPQSNKSSRKLIPGVVSMRKHGAAVGALNPDSGNGDQSKAGLDNPDLGPFLLKQARDLISSGDNPQKALDFAVRAAKSFETCSDGKPSLELVMSLHVVAAIYCNLGQYEQAIPVLEHSLEIPLSDDSEEHALAKFSGCMQLGDTYAMLGKLENSIDCYTAGLEIQKQVLGETDPRVGETCRYLAEAHVQALQFNEAEKLCQMALDIHRENGDPASLEEIADRRLMGLICDSKGDHEAALEHLVLASMAMVSNGQETEVASVDCTIGDAYLSLARYDEAVFAYQKALTVFKTSKGENHPAVASVFVRLADLYNKTGKLREAKSYCESALRIYGKPVQGTTPEEIANGLTDVSAIYELMNEPDQALKLLQRALKIYDDAPGHQSMIAGIEAQMGALYYMIGDYVESYAYFKNAVAKLRASGEKKSAFFGIALNQMGLTCLQQYSINEAADLFEEARSVLEQEYGPYHPDTLGVYSNLAGTYDAMGRLDDAIEILEYVVGIREERLGTANPDVADEKRRLGELLKEAGKVRSRKAKSLETLMT